MDNYNRYAEYQTPCLEKLKETRKNGSRGLIVMAGGLGKTIVAARDVRDFLDENPGKRVLFLCHDTGILAQNKKKFEAIVGDGCHCGLFIGIEKEFEPVDVLFASFQTLGGHDKWMQAFLENEFAYIIVDEYDIIGQVQRRPILKAS
ncbi:MAG: DEAD/DEAH box helicase family protein [Lachnospiraceae bacterium]|nr:DEAD/DEAH box helicase family protein [Muribaculaceae bacterium]MCM1411067.1 DEAD/DEAH box helicase family protein [Lachnospiraceae bacterium]